VGAFFPVILLEPIWKDQSTANEEAWRFDRHGVCVLSIEKNNAGVRMRKITLLFILVMLLASVNTAFTLSITSLDIIAPNKGYEWDTNPGSDHWILGVRLDGSHAIVQVCILGRTKLTY
jgi:hypothetical protein